MYTANYTQAHAAVSIEPQQEISLRSLTLIQLLNYPDAYSEYQDIVTRFLRIKGLTFTPQQMLEKANKSSLEKISNEKPARYIYVGTKRENGNELELWVDMMMEYYFTPEDDIYSLVLAYKLRDYDLLKIDPFLYYHQNKYFQDELEAFSRFVELTLRQYAGLIPDACVLTVKEWIMQQKRYLENQSDRLPVKVKGRPRRERDDNQTALNQELTALFIQYLQKGQIIFSGEYLTNKQAGEAFHILTGYSAATLRQSLNTTEIDKIATKKNLTSLYNTIARLSIFIDRDLKK